MLTVNQQNAKNVVTHGKLKINNMNMKTIFVVLLSVVSLIYLINPTAGIFELLPDNLPFIGNVDEGLAALIIYSGVEYFRGKKIGIFGQRKK